MTRFVNFNHPDSPHHAQAASGGPPGNGGIENRLAKLEADMGHIQNDIAEMKGDIRAQRAGLEAFGKDTNAEFRSLRREMKQDFRVQFRALIFATLGLAGLLAKGFDWV